MIEQILYQYLSAKLAAPVYTEIPKSAPLAFYSIEKTGGTISNHITSDTVAIKSYAGSLYEAAQMNEKLKEAMLYGLITLNEIVKVELNSDYNFTDTQTKQYRYQAVFDIKHY